MVNETVPVVAKSSGPIVEPSGLVPNFRAAAASGPRTARSGCVDSTGPAPRPRPRPPAAAAPAAGAPRPAGAAPRITTRGLRQRITGETPGIGLTSAKVRYTFHGPGVGVGAPRP